MTPIYISVFVGFQTLFFPLYLCTGIKTIDFYQQVMLSK